jgi:hypothetical protein
MTVALLAMGLPRCTPANGFSSDEYVALFTNVVAGDYAALRIAADGSAQLTRWNRSNVLTERKEGRLEPQRLAQLRRGLSGEDFRRLSGTYDVYPLPPGGTLAVEDVYYVLVHARASSTKVVVAHASVVPPSLRELLDTLRDASSALRDAPALGTFVMAGDHEVLGFKRFGAHGPTVTLTDEDLRAAPALARALSIPYSLQSLPGPATGKLAAAATANPPGMVASTGSHRFDVLLLRSDQGTGR